MTEEFKLPDGIKDPSLEFDLKDNLGKGSFGAVYLAEHKKTGHLVAVKQVLVNEDFMEILKEINIMKQCNSKYVVQYYGNYFKGDTCWIIMEYCAYGSVGDIMNLTSAPLTEPQIALVIRSTLKGLHYLHKSHKIHRDIKPGNVLVTSRGECKLADFGVSGQLSERTHKRNTVIGTPFFLAPEVILETGYDSKADVWAVGISAIELAEIHPPHYDVHPMRVLFLIPTSPSPTLRKPELFSETFSDFIRLCLQKDPSQRPSAKELLEHPFIKSAPGPSIMQPLLDKAQSLIDKAGGRLKAMKHAAAQRMDAQKEDEEDIVEDVIGPVMVDSDSDEEDKNKRSFATPPADRSVSLKELDDLLDGMMTKKFDSPKLTASGSSSPAPKAAQKAVAASSPNGSCLLGEWTSSTAGGCVNTYLWRRNPQFIFKVVVAQTVKITLRQVAEKISHIGIYLAKAGDHQGRKILSLTKDNVVADIETSFKKAKQITVEAKLAVGEYIIIPSTFSFGIIGNFEIEVEFTSGKPDLQALEEWYASSTSSEWKGQTAGGCFSPNSSTWRENPKALLTVKPSSAGNSTVTILLGKDTDAGIPVDAASSAKSTLFVGFYVFKTPNKGAPTTALTGSNLVGKTNFVNSSDVLSTLNLEAGDYVIVPCSFDPGQEARFTLTIFSSGRIEPLNIVKEEGTGVKGVWEGPSAGGCLNHPTWRSNPQYLLEIPPSPSTQVTISLEQVGSGTDGKSMPFIGFYVAKAPPAPIDKKMFSLAPKDVVGNTEFINDLQVSLTLTLTPANSPCIVIPSTFLPKVETSFTLRAAIEAGQGTVKFTPLPSWGWQQTTGSWKGPSAGGRYSTTSNSWQNNPRFVFNLTGGSATNGSGSSGSSGRIAVVLSQSEKPTPIGIGFYIFKKLPDNGLREVVGKSGFVSGREVSLEVALPPGEVFIIPATFEPNQEDTFNLTVYSDQNFSLTPFSQ
eukprot:TRINITY_DN3018_c0_g1_i1.p1 TRINITY_DN3018_c0_g1~~TRINITY_DN3018_c0_g1_i1.p1  ORF type:complete len:963 (-),score=250.30 TRINITY_DN3018_c0_g1_i1:195-3083(-)